MSMWEREPPERPQDMTLADAVADLAEHGSDDDPITWRGEDTTPNQLLWKAGSGDNYYQQARNIRVTYWAKRSRVHGTISGMVRDRRGD